ncbi:MAG: sugar-binding transcriptional regulator [Anaerolineales bacterium]|nr:MAG: sugar-binding transcriptional regulator [Anaerolineales bacterium]
MTISLQDQRLWAKVAKLYYEDDFTQGEIAKKLGYSRVKIHRVLQAAKEAGIVQVLIKTGDTATIDLETSLIHKYNLRDCVVIENNQGGEESYQDLARGASSWLKQHLQPGTRVGLGLGRTLSYLPIVFEIEKNVNCIFTEVAGAISDHSWGFETNNIASQMAEKCGGKAELFYAPTLVSNSALKEELIKERSVKKALERARSCDIVLQSVGPVDETAILFINGYLSRAELDDLKEAGAVGDALGCYFNKDGQILSSPIDNLMIGLHLSELVDLPWSVLVGGGAEKVVPISAALKGKYFNVLVTDLQTAETLLGKG